MNKEWFIFKGTHHLGPFSLQEMEEFFIIGEIGLQSLVWREGAEKWEALGKTHSLEYLFKKSSPELVISELSELPIDLPPPVPPTFLHHPDGLKVEADDFDLPPPIPLDALLNPLGKRPDFTRKQESTFTNSSKLFLGLFSVVFVMVLFWFYLNEKSSSIQIRIKGIMPVYVEKLQDIATQKTPAIMVGMALSLDGKTLYASTNKEGEILTIIKMKSLPRRILGTAEVELLVRGVIRDHQGEYAKMQLVRGLQFVPGEYEIDFTGKKIFFLNRWFKSLNGVGFFKRLNTTYNYQTTALIYAGTPREFEKKLLEYKDAIENEKLKPLNDKLERIQTFLALLNKTVESYLLILEKIKTPKEISIFEGQYIKEISPIIQSLVIAANDLAKAGESREVDTSTKVASYASQVQLGKAIGELASDMITETGKLKKISESDKGKLKSHFEGRYKNIKSQIDDHIIKLQTEIHKITY